MSARDTCCNTCPNWTRIDNESGKCRRHAPRVWPEGTFGGFEPDKAWFPVVRESDVCGEHPNLLTERER